MSEPNSLMFLIEYYYQFQCFLYNFKQMHQKQFSVKVNIEKCSQNTIKKGLSDDIYFQQFTSCLYSKGKLDPKNEFNSIYEINKNKRATSLVKLDKLERWKPTTNSICPAGPLKYQNFNFENKHQTNIKNMKNALYSSEKLSFDVNLDEQFLTHSEIQDKKLSLYSYKMKMLFCNRPLIEYENEPIKHGLTFKDLQQQKLILNQGPSLILKKKDLKDQKKKKRSNSISSVNYHLNNIPVIPTKSEIQNLASNKNYPHNNSHNNIRNNLNIKKPPLSGLENINFDTVKLKINTNDKFKDDRISTQKISILQCYLNNFLCSLRFFCLKNIRFPHFQFLMDFITSNSKQLDKKLDKKFQRNHYKQQKIDLCGFEQAQKERKKLWHIFSHLYQINSHKLLQFSTSVYKLMIQNPYNLNYFIIDVSLSQSPNEIAQKIRKQEQYRYQWFNIQNIRKTLKINISSCYEKRCLVMTHLYGNQVHFLPIEQKIKQYLLPSSSMDLKKQDQNRLKLVLDYEKKNIISVCKSKIIRQATQLYLDTYHKQNFQNIGKKMARIQFQPSVIPNLAMREQSIKEIDNQQKFKRKWDRYHKFRQILSVINHHLFDNKVTMLQKIFPVLDQKFQLIKTIKTQKNDEFKINFRKLKTNNYWLQQKLFAWKKVQHTLKFLESKRQTGGILKEQNNIVDKQPQYYRIYSTRVSQLDYLEDYSKNQKLDGGLEQFSLEQLQKIFSWSTFVQFKKEENHKNLEKNELNKNRANVYIQMNRNLISQKTYKVKAESIHNNSLILYYMHSGTFYLSRVNPLAQHFHMNKSGHSLLNKHSLLILTDFPVKESYQSCTLNRKQMLLIHFFALHFDPKYSKKKIQHNQTQRGSYIINKYLVLKTERYNNFKHTHQIIIAIQEQLNIDSQQGIKNTNSFQCYIKYLMQNSIINTLDQLKSVILFSLNHGFAAKYKEETKDKKKTYQELQCCNSTFLLSMNNQSGIILNQSLLKPTNQSTNINFYTLLVKASVIFIKKQNLQLKYKIPTIYYQLTVQFYPSANVVFVKAQTSSQKLRVTGYIQKNKREIEKIQFIASIPARCFSLNTYNDNYFFIISQVYNQLLISRKHKKSEEKSKEHFRESMKKMKKAQKKEQNSKSDDHLSENKNEERFYNFLGQLKRKVKQKLSRLMSLTIKIKLDSEEKQNSKINTIVGKVSLNIKREFSKNQDEKTKQYQYLQRKQKLQKMKIMRSLKKQNEDKNEDFIRNKDEIKNKKYTKVIKKDDLTSSQQLSIKDDFSISKQTNQIDQNSIKIDMLSYLRLWYNFQKNKELSLVIFQPGCQIKGNNKRFCQYLILSINDHEKLDSQAILYCKSMFTQNNFIVNQKDKANKSEQIEKSLSVFKNFLKKQRSYKYFFVYPFYKFINFCPQNKFWSHKNLRIIKYNQNYIRKSEQNLDLQNTQDQTNYFVVHFLKQQSAFPINSHNAIGKKNNKTKIQRIEKHISNFKISLIKSKISKQTQRKLRGRFLKIVKTSPELFQ